MVEIWWEGSLLHSVIQEPRLLRSYGHAILQGLGILSTQSADVEREHMKDFPEDFSGSDQEMACVTSAHLLLARTITCPPVRKGDRGVGLAVCLGSRSPLGHKAFSVTLANLQIGKPNHPGDGKIIFLLNQSILS